MTSCVSSRRASEKTTLALIKNAVFHVNLGNSIHFTVALRWNIVSATVVLRVG